MEFFRSKHYVSLVIHSQLHCFLLERKKNQFQVITSDMITGDYAGIFDNHLINPSFFIDVLQRFFEKNNIKKPLIALLTPHEHYAYLFQYELYFEYFRVPIKHVITKKTTQSIEQSAIDIWQGELHGT